MRAVRTERIGVALLAVLIVGGLVWFAWPQPIPVDLAPVTRGSMEVTVDDDAKTHVRHIYTIYAPIAGTVLRISNPHGETGISRHVGDQVTANETVVALMQPAIPGFVDIRSREELQQAVAAADAAVKEEEAEIRRLQAAVDFFLTELRRTETLARAQTASAQALDRARYDATTNEAALASAKAQLEVRRSIRESLAARLLDPSSSALPSNSVCCVQIRSPVTGRILKIIQESEAVVPAGAPLIEIGDPLDLEIVADLSWSSADRRRGQRHHRSPALQGSWPPPPGRAVRLWPSRHRPATLRDSSSKSTGRPQRHPEPASPIPHPRPPQPLLPWKCPAPPGA